MDNLLSVKRGRIILAAILNLALIACLVFVYLKLRTAQNVIVPSIRDEPGFKEMSVIVIVFKIGLAGLIGFLLLHTINLARLKIYYDEAGIQVKSLFRNWKTSWLQIETAYIGRRSLFIKSTGGSLSVPRQLLSGNLDKLASYVPAEVFLDKDSAIRQEKKRHVKILLAIILSGAIIFVAFERYFKPYLVQVENQRTQVLEKYLNTFGIKIVHKKDTK